MIVAMLLAAAVAYGDPSPGTPAALLGRPTDHSVTVSLVAASDLDAFVEHGPAPGAYGARSEPISLRAGTPAEVVMDGLEPDRAYVYRVLYRTPGASAFFAGEEHRFQTQRRRGSSFTFAVDADPHLDANTSPELLMRSLGNVLAARPDFLIDLGDTFMTEKLAPTPASGMDRYRLLRSSFDAACHSIPLFLVPGNHDGEAGWFYDGTSDNIAVWTTNMRKQFFPNPGPDAFYSGDSTEYPFVGLRQATYAWEWGDALFVVLDPFWNTTSRGAGQWSWTLGRDQYRWLEGVLRDSRAAFKFVFIHHLVGGLDSNARGGVEAATLYEWGGRSADGRMDFDARRPGWGRPIHQLMVDNGVSVVFHGHDHFYARQELDGVIYQEVPQPGWPGLNLPDPSLYGYRSGVFFPSSGDLLVTVSPSRVTVEYVRALLPKDEKGGRANGAVVDSYSIESKTAASGERRRAVRR